MSYKIYYTNSPDLGIEEWSNQVESAFYDWGGITILSGLTPLTIYTVRVRAYTINASSPLSSPLQVKTQYRGADFSLPHQFQLLDS